MSFSFSDLSSAPGAGGGISPGDVRAIRRSVRPDEVLERAEAETLLEIHRRAAASVTPSENVWLDFTVARDKKRDELEALLRFLDEDE
jgi:hypothetical protein